METLRSYLKTLSPLEQADFARRAGTTIGYLRKALSKGQRFGGALVRQLHIQSGGYVCLTDLRADIWPADEQQPSRAKETAALIDSRMSKRALRAKLGLSSDALLAKVLGLPVEQVSGWADEDMVPSLPQVMKLLGHAEQQEPAQPANEDPDADRIAPIEVA